jgi:imidazolonepropionase-like amidohydrolase
LIGVIAGLVWNERTILDAVRRSQEMIRQLHDAGVPIVVGTDTPGTPYFHYNFHGPTILREIELVAAAGLSPEETLAAATRIPAQMVGLGAELGTVERGKRRTWWSWTVIR